VLRIPALVIAYLSTDLVVSIGGIIGHITSLFPLLLGAIFGKQIAIYSVSTTGSFRNRFYRFLTRQILNRVTVITCREEISRRILKRLRLNKPQVHVTADEVFLLKDVSKQEIDDILLQENIAGKNRPLVGVNISRRPNSDSATHEKYLCTMADLANYLIDTLEVTVLLLPFCFARGYDDRLENVRVGELIRDKEEMKLITHSFGPGELKGIAGRMEIFIGTRTHANIIALSAATPTLAISYHHKMSGTMEALQMSEWVCNYAELSSSQLITKTQEMWSQREDVRNEPKKRVRIMEDKASANSQLIGELLANK